MDPASRDRLMQDLQQTDPSLWPLVIQQFRAGLAYRQQTEQRKSGALSTSPAETGHNDCAHPSGRPAPGNTHHGNLRRPSPQPARRTSNRHQAPRNRRLPPQAPPSPPVQSATSTAKKAEATAEQTSKTATGSNVVQASYEAAKREDDKGDYRNHLAAAIRACEGELSTPAKTPEDEARHAQLRMMQLLAGRRDDAMKSIPGAKSAVQNFWSAEIYGLSLWMDAEANARRLASSGRGPAAPLRRRGEAGRIVSAGGQEPGLLQQDPELRLHQAVRPLRILRRAERVVVRRGGKPGERIHPPRHPYVVAQQLPDPRQSRSASGRRGVPPSPKNIVATQDATISWDTNSAFPTGSIRASIRSN